MKQPNCFLFSTGVNVTVPHRLLLQAGSNTTMITRHHHHPFPKMKKNKTIKLLFQIWFFTINFYQHFDDFLWILYSRLCFYPNIVGRKECLKSTFLNQIWKRWKDDFFSGLLFLCGHLMICKTDTQQNNALVQKPSPA
jgi:hypothetical protein